MVRPLAAREAHGAHAHPPAPHAFELGSNRWIDAGVYPLPRTAGADVWMAGGPERHRPAVAERRRAGASGGPAAGSDRITWADAASPCSRLTDQVDLGFLGAVAAGAECSSTLRRRRPQRAGRRAHVHLGAVRAARGRSPGRRRWRWVQLHEPRQPAGGDPRGRAPGRQLLPAHERGAAGLLREPDRRAQLAPPPPAHPPAPPVHPREPARARPAGSSRSTSSCRPSSRRSTAAIGCA